MNVISGLRNSGFLAQSAYSASIATKDNLGRDITSTYLTSHQDISNLMPKSESANFYPMEGNPSGFLTTHQDLSDYQTIEGMTAYQPVGDYYSASNPSGFITGVDLTPYYTTAAANTLSSMFSGAIDYVSSNAGNQEVSNVVQSNSSTWNNVTAKQNTLTFRYGTSSGSITSINGSAIVDDYTYHMLNVTRNHTASMNKVLTANSAKWNQVTAKLNTTAFSTVSGDFLTAHQSLDGYATEDWITSQGYITGVEIPESATWNEVSTAYQNTSATYLTAVDLTPYATTAEVDSISSMLSGAIDYVSANAGGEFPISADEAIQYVQTNSANIDDTVTSYQTNSSDYLKESELGYNAVDEVSAINGSAIAQYGAEKQWLVHDDTLVHAANSAQYALGVNLSAVAQLLGVDETVLWRGTKSTTAGSESLYDNMWNYDKLDFYLTFDTTQTPQRAQCISRYYVGNHTTAQPLYVYLTANNIASNTLTAEVMYFSGTPDGNNFGLLGGIRRVNSTVSTGITSYNAKLVEIRGIGRKEV